MQPAIKKLYVDSSGKVKNYYKGKFVGHLFAAAFVLFFILMKDAAPAPNSYTATSYYEPKDTIPPKKAALYSVSYDILTWQKKLDTLDGVMSNIGRSLSVDDATRLRLYFNSVLGDMIRQIQVQQADTLKNKN